MAGKELKWIPIEEGLPKENRRVLVTTLLSGKDPFVLPSWYGTLMFPNEPDFYESSDYDYGKCKINDAIAWMPFPEPYMERID